MSGGAEHRSNKVRFQVYHLLSRERGGGGIGNRERHFFAFFFLQVS